MNAKMEQELALTQFHPSYFENFRYVYPVVSRRSGGVSIGINLSPTKRCNFRCVYCQVERRASVADSSANSSANSNSKAKIDLDVLRKELTAIAKLTLNGDLFQFERFSKTPPEKRFLRDFAFSGDGEPTLASEFGAAVEVAADVRRALEFNDLKLILITNATRLRESDVVAALDRFAKNNGEIWAKLDAGDSERCQTIDRTNVPFKNILDNIEFASRRWGVKVQTAALSWNGAAPTPLEVERYCDRIRAFVDAGGSIRDVQLYTVARIPTESGAVALADSEMNALAATIREKTGLRVDVFYSK